MKPETQDKKKGWSLSMTQAEIEQTEALIARHGGTDRTEFCLRALAFFDGLQPGNPDMLVNLAKVYHPTLQPELAAAIKQYQAQHPAANPAKMVAYFLDELAAAMRAGHDLDAPFRIVSMTQQEEWEQTRSNYEGMLSAVFRKLGLTGEATPALAEDATPYAAAGQGEARVHVSIHGKRRTLSTRRGKKLSQNPPFTGQPKLTPHSAEEPA